MVSSSLPAVVVALAVVVVAVADSVRPAESPSRCWIAYWGLRGGGERGVRRYVDRMDC